MKILIRLGLLTLLSVSSSVLASESRPDHFKGKPSATWQEAQQNFSQANSHLRTILEKSKLDLKDSANIHELSYTLENAIKAMTKQLQQTADVLEELHQLSETTDTEKTKQTGAAYLSTAKQMEY